MHLVLREDKLEPWNKARLSGIDKEQKDYSYLDKDNIEVFVYGYPYQDKKAAWISACDVYQMYLEIGTDFVKEVEGVYAIVILDRTKCLCEIIIDRYGMYNLFYTKAANSFIISDNLGKIISHTSDIKLNESSVIEFLSFGFVIGDKTHIEGVYRFEPATVYRIEGDLDIKKEVYWKYYEGKERHRISREDFRNAFNEYILTGLKLEERISLPLTGGVDTRTILSACIPQRKRLHCYTHGLRDAKDVKLAKKICEKFNIEHDVYTLDGKWVKNIPSLVEENIDIYNGMINLFWSLHLKNSYEKEDGKGELFFSGVMANEMWRIWFVNGRLLKAKSVDEVASVILAILGRSLTYSSLDIYRRYDREQIIKLFKESIKYELPNGKMEEPVILSEMFALKTRAANNASYAAMFAGKQFKLFHPFLNRYILQKIPFLDLGEKRHGAIQKYIISKNHPWLAKIPFDKGMCISKNPYLRLKSWILVGSDFFKKAVNKTSRELFKKEFFKIPYFTDYAYWLRHYHREYVLEILSYENMILKDYFKKDALEKTINLFLGGQDKLLSFVTNLMSLEIWLKGALKSAKNTP